MKAKKDRLVRGNWWVKNSQKKKIERIAKKSNTSESDLMRALINTLPN